MSTKYFLVACLLLAVIPQQILCQDVSVQALMSYNKWRYSFKRVYLNEDEQIYRQTVFFENHKRVDEHNQNSESTYKIGLNQFSDMTKEEISQKIFNRRVVQQQASIHQQVTVYESPRGAATKIAASVDWRKKGVVAPIKDQGSCGSCWTFATSGVLESFNAITNGKLVTFSQQQLLDCATEAAGYDAAGCDGGWPTEALKYVQKFGIVTDQSYPYVGIQGKCKITSPTKGFYPKTFQQVDKTPEALKSALNIAPVAVLVNADPISDYESGIFNGCQETTEYDLNHAVIAVGYDAKGNWIVRNSWSSTWGEKGYIRLAPGNTCGILLSNQVVTK